MKNKEKKKNKKARREPCFFCAKNLGYGPYNQIVMFKLLFFITIPTIKSKSFSNDKKLDFGYE